MSEVTLRAEDTVSIEIDGKKLDVKKGSMIIEAADDEGIKIPRFCYHKKLSVAANCRMCMVDVEKAPKPMPACATPVMDGMKIYTQSRRATDAQRNVMEFLLINHPLDCPICDQGGECELQDVSMGYGRDISRYVDSKRVVKDENLGSLVATDMTRCILCTRCVRFLNEIAGTDELGGIGRGDRTNIATAVGESVNSEMSGNIIDLCPVGALTNKPFRYKARVWELMASSAISMHDAIGSNLFYHARQGEILRTVPQDNEALNENWLSDRDRYSAHGLRAEDRLLTPEFKHNGKWQQTSWEEALAMLADKLKSVSGDEIKLLASSYASTEEYLLLKQLMDALGCRQTEHRIRQTQWQQSARMPRVDVSLAEVSAQKQIILVGSYARHEQPILNHRIRQAWLAGAQVSAFNHKSYEHNYDLLLDVVDHAQGWVEKLGSLAHCLGDRAGEHMSGDIGDWVKSQATDEDLNHLAKRLLNKENPALFVIGQVANNHPQAAMIKAVVAWMAQVTQGRVYEMAEGANSVGATLAGFGSSSDHWGENHQVTLLYQAELEDFSDMADARNVLKNSNFSVSFNAFCNDAMREYCDLLLPIALLPEVTGSVFNNLRQRQVSMVSGKAPGETKSGWRVLRVLGNLLELDGFDYQDVSEVMALTEKLNGANGIIDQNPAIKNLLTEDQSLVLTAERAIYDSDQLCRRSEPLQSTVHTSSQTIWLHPNDIAALNLNVGDKVTLQQQQRSSEWVLSMSEEIAEKTAYVYIGHTDSGDVNLSELTVQIQSAGVA
ncbi:NADH-quinone oxidoreductase subunit NuoG [Marinicella sp. W31]|uniref:NADH-quinone oxidoreductase subunit NuoG n=1 Tax=Marinicella sp. W31 TaxID=3023713 RepID=UPI003756A614